MLRRICVESLRRNTRLFSTQICSRVMDTLDEVKLDNGRWKYVLIEVSDKDGNKKHLVRSKKLAAWHADIFEPIDAMLHKKGLEADCIGGGRIEKSEELKKIHVYGYSQAYGQANHELSCQLIRKKYTDYDVTCSNEGY